VSGGVAWSVSIDRNILVVGVALSFIVSGSVVVLSVLGVVARSSMVASAVVGSRSVGRGDQADGGEGNDRGLHGECVLKRRRDCLMNGR
jgi:hypothetical protein